MIQIRNRYTGDVICEGETVAAAVQANQKNLCGANLTGANLCGADLRSANLRGANLRSADLRSANLTGADLTGADLTGADLTGADLAGADLRSANLTGAYLRGANLCGADLRSANLRGANLRSAKLAWQSHDLLAEILRCAAGDDVAKLKVAGLILISRDKCWQEFLGMAEHEPLAGWTLDELAKWVQPDDGAPEVIRQRVAANEAVLGSEK